MDTIWCSNLSAGANVSVRQFVEEIRQFVEKNGKAIGNGQRWAFPTVIDSNTIVLV